MKKIAMLLGLGLLLTDASSAQLLKRLGEKASSKVENAVNRKVENKVDRAIDKTLDKISEPGTKEKSKPDRKEVKTEKPVNVVKSSEDRPVVQQKEVTVQKQTIYEQEDCAKAAEKKKGKWEEGPVFNYDYPLPDEKRFAPNMERVMDNIANQIIKSYPAPEGSTVRWAKWFARSGDTVSTPDRFLYAYEFAAKFLPFICNKGKIEAYGIADVWMFVRVNRFHPSEITQQKEINTVLKDKVFSLGKLLGTFDGYPWFEPAPTGVRQIPEVVYNSVLLHRPGRLPYTAVTRGELLDMCKKWLAMAESGKVKTTGSLAAMQTKLNKLYDLNKADLDKPAIIRHPEWNFNDLNNIDPDKQNIFTTPADGYQLLRADPSYVDQSESKWKPQFAVVTWYNVTGRRYSDQLNKVMSGQFDYKKLAEVIFGSVSQPKKILFE